MIIKQDCISYNQDYINLLFYIEMTLLIKKNCFHVSQVGSLQANAIIYQT